MRNKMRDPIVLTGAGSGIGQALACVLDKRGEELVLVGRRKQTLQETKAKLQQDCLLIEADLGLPEARTHVVKELSAFSKIRTLIHNASVIEPFSSLAGLSLNDWQRLMSINVEAPLFLTQALLAQLNGSRVLHISSGARFLSIPSMIPYCISKECLYRLYEGFKTEIRETYFASVCPGIVNTKMVGLMLDSSELPKEQHQFYLLLKEKGFLIPPELVAQFLAWLILDVSNEKFSEKEWDIYDSSHHQHWAKGLKLPPSPEQIDLSSDYD